MMRRLTHFFKLVVLSPMIVSCATPDDSAIDAPAEVSLGGGSVVGAWEYGFSDVGSGGGNTFGLGLDGRVYKAWGSSWLGTNGYNVNDLAVDASGQPWVTTYDGSIFVADTEGSAWTVLPGAASSVGTGGAGGSFVGGGGNVYGWNGSGWNSYGAGGINKVDGDIWGLPWAVGYDSTIWRWNGGWQLFPGGATDIGVSRDTGDVYVVGGDSQIWNLEYDDLGLPSWSGTGVFGKRVSGGRNGDVYVVGLDSRIRLFEKEKNIQCTVKCAVVALDGGSNDQCFGWADAQGSGGTEQQCKTNGQKNVNNGMPSGCRAKHCKIVK